ncbi:ATP-binding protein [Spirosoma sp. KNUC1025]|uniref:ATP-binding protein n=1 Tax=Spirosoma sp. KNUC1025 TaxID=2894082 RepID=UPI001E3AD542|nr:ATP-binding protein [Spirosoma sp. KNUC1025]UFH57586.1 histidine kinase [Spirosoma sp. KNUC1025]
MKSLPLVAFLYLVGITAWGQTVFRLDSLPQQGILLDKAWKWHLGDNPEWAKSNFDDSRWDTINPTQDVNRLKQLPMQGIGWLRIRMHIAPELYRKMVGIRIQQAGAAEFFLNEKLVIRNGKISLRKNIELGSTNLYDYSHTISFEPDSIQLIAIRYAFSRDPLPINRYRYSFFTIKVLPTEEAAKFESQLTFAIGIEAVLFGVFLFLGLLQLLLYAVSTEQPTAFSLGLFLVTQSIVHLMNGLLNTGDFFYTLFGITHVLPAHDTLYIVFVVALAVSSFWYLLGIYQYFGQTRKSLFWLAASVCLATIPMALFLAQPLGFLSQFIPGFIIPGLEILRIGLVALKQKKTGANLFTLAHGITLATFIGWTLSIFLPVALSSFTTTGQLLFTISFLGLALTISLLLAQERAVINQLLRKQLIDLDFLSQKTIAQEQEKQQLLATQNELLEQQVEARTAELKASQVQLIQKEKLASLGELTAGIAHEIQNPLNFVNNFSEVSAELVDDLEEELEKGDTEEAKAIAGDLRQNLQKINHHGGRASRIVKGMLDHSRPMSDERQPTDLNVLADEYLRLAYQGQRGNDKSFQCELLTHFDPALGKVNVAPGEIGRVLLNLYTNAFYAVAQRAKQAIGSDYKSRVEVRTQRQNNRIMIQVSDNGTGIAESAKGKIFQPFFTTKPTGEGTGLGLSLSYDIVTKGHGGTLTLESQEGQGTHFLMQLPDIR